MLVVWGLTAVGVLSGSAPVKGLLAALLGLLISTIGIDNKSGLERFVFDTIYLEDGINIVILGLGKRTNTANTFPSVLLAVPGSVGSQATIVDGYPMAQNGEAKRAFGAAFSASAIGGIFGAVVLFASR